MNFMRPLDWLDHPEMRGYSLLLSLYVFGGIALILGLAIGLAYLLY